MQLKLMVILHNKTHTQTTNTQYTINGWILAIIFMYAATPISRWIFTKTNFYNTIMIQCSCLTLELVLESISVELWI